MKIVPKHKAKLNQCSRSYLYVLVYFMFTSYAFSQTYPTPEPNTATFGTYEQPSESLPNYLQWFGADLSDSRILRISDRELFGVTGQNLRHNYSLDQTWNSDETLIKLAGYPAAIIDAETFEFLYWSNIPSYGRWSNTQPNIIYGTPANQFVAHNVTTNTRTVLRIFTEYNSIDFGFGKGNQDKNDKYVGLIAENGNETTLIVYDIQNNAIVSTLNTSDVRWFSVSQSGNYLVVARNFDNTGNGTGGAQKDIVSYNINFENLQVVYTNGTPHGDLGVDAYGNEVYIGYGTQLQWSNNYSLFMSRLDTGEVTNLFPYVNGRGIWGGHISARNLDREGWAYVSEQCCYTNPVAAAEIFAIKLDDSGIVERYTKHNNNPVGYLHSVQAVPNRNGTKVLFTSNWFDAFEMSQTSAHDFVLEVNQETLSTTEVTVTPELPTQVNYYNILGQKVSENYKGFLIKESIYKNRVERKKMLLISRD